MLTAAFLSYDGVRLFCLMMSWISWLSSIPAAFEHVPALALPEN